MGRKPADSPEGPGSQGDEPSLELPSLNLPRLGRRRGHKDDRPGDGRGPEVPDASDAPDVPAVPASHRIDHDRSSGSVLPALPGRLAAVITGLVVGLFGTIATSAALAGCEAMTGTSSCGGPGFFLLLAILALMVLLGMGMLKAWKVADAGSTSLLAVGVVTVVMLLLLLDAIFSVWMFLVVPLLAAASYALAHWVTTRFGDETQARRPEV